MMRIALVQQFAEPDRERNLQRGLDALSRAAERGAGRSAPSQASGSCSSR